MKDPKCQCGECKGCKSRASSRKWYAANAERAREMARRWREENPEKARHQYAEYNRRRDLVALREKRRGTVKSEAAKLWIENNRERVRSYQRKQRLLNPERARAVALLNRRVRSGSISRQPCEVCGDINRIQAHHEDYSRPLDVRWLCKKHHAEVHWKAAA